MNRDNVDFSNLGFYDADFFKPLPPGEEYPRLPSPPTSVHYSQSEDFSYSKYASHRNTEVEDYLQEEKKKVPIASSNNIPPDEKIEDDLEDENDTVVMSRDSEDEVYPTSRNNDTIKQILRSAFAKEQGIVDSYPGGGVSFCFVKFQRVLQIKWNIIVLQRLENLLIKRILESIPKEWLDFHSQFAMIYGPLDKSNGKYSSLLQQFETGRQELHSEMQQRECQVLEIMRQNPTSDYDAIALQLKQERLELETKLKSYSEANLDLNPFTNGLRMDFFVLPRPTPPIYGYTVRPHEMNTMIEFNVDGDEDKLYGAEGYNAAIIDVGCLYPEKIVGDESRSSYWEKTWIWNERRAFLKWHEILRHLKAEMGAYPVGVASSVFIKKFRKQWKYTENEVIFGKYEDDKCVLKISDVFYPQFLGKDQRVILFQGVLEGLIVTPGEILVRVWKKMRHLLEVYHRIELDDLEELYETYFAQPLYNLQWGFGSMFEFVEYSCATLPGELADVKVVEKHQLKVEKDNKDEAVGVDGQTNASDGDGWKEAMDVKDEIQPLDPFLQWMVLEEPVPANCVFKFPNPIPFDMLS